MKKLFTLFTLTLTILFYNFSYSQTASKTVSLEDFIKAYVAHSYELKIKYEDLRAARGKKLLAESVDDLTLNAEAGYTHASDIDGLADGSKGDLFTGSVGLSKQFSASGTVVQITDAFGTGKVAGSDGGSNKMTFSIIQPVLKNFFGYMSRIPIAQAALSLRAAELDYQESVESTISNAVNMYLQWIAYYKEKEMLKEIIKNNQVVFRQARAQLRAGIAEVSDLEISRVAVIQYQQQLSANKSKYDSLILELNDYLAVNTNDKPDAQVLTSYTADFPNIDLNPNYIRSIRSLNYLLDAGQMSVDYARNMYLPSLDVVASYINMAGESAFLGSAGGASGKNNLYVGLQFSMPLFEMEARGTELQYIAQFEQILLQRDQAIRNILRMTKDVQNQLEMMNEQLKQQKTLIQALKRQVESQTRQFKRGTLDLDNLVTGRNSLSNAMLNENTLQIQASQLYNSYLEIIDKLQEKYKDALPENIIFEDSSSR